MININDKNRRLIFIKKIIHIVLFAFGALNLSFLVIQYPFEHYSQTLQHINWFQFWGLILVYPLLWKSIHAFSWGLLLPQKIHIPFSQLWITQVSSGSVGDLFPFGGIGGEGYRTFRLGNIYSQHRSTIIFSVLLYNNLYGFASFSFFILALILCVCFIPSLPFFLVLILLSFSAVGLGAMFFLFFLQKQGKIIHLIFKTLGRLPFLKKHQNHFLNQMNNLSNQMQKLSNISPFKRNCFIILMFFTRCLGIVESYYIQTILHLNIPFISLLFFYAFEQLMIMIFFIVPSQIGVLESGGMKIAPFLSVSEESGLILGLFKRIRTIIWGLLGLILILPWFNPSKNKNKDI